LSTLRLARGLLLDLAQLAKPHRANLRKLYRQARIRSRQTPIDDAEKLLLCAQLIGGPP